MSTPEGGADRLRTNRNLRAVEKIIDTIEVGGNEYNWVNLQTAVWDDMRISESSTRLGVIAPTLETGFRGDANCLSLNFVNTQDDEVQFSVQFPHTWKVGTTIYPHVHFSPYIAGTGTRAVKFILAYRWADRNGQFPASESTIELTKTWDSDLQWYHLRAYNDTGITDATKNISSMMMCRLYRDNTVTNNLAGKVAFLEFDIHYQIDTMGTISESTKP